jgi:hypothetical protein
MSLCFIAWIAGIILITKGAALLGCGLLVVGTVFLIIMIYYYNSRKKRSMQGKDEVSIQGKEQSNSNCYWDCPMWIRPDCDGKDKMDCDATPDCDSSGDCSPDCNL